MHVSHAQVLAYRTQVQGLDRAGGHEPGDAAILDYGVQDTGPDGASWALVNRGVDSPELARRADDFLLAWTLRGAPHLYRRRDVAAVAAATAPFSEADAAKRIFDASKPLKAAGVASLDALDQVATTMRAIVTRPTVKGDVSSELRARLDEPYLRYCRPCDAIHPYEMPFRLAALRGGLELQPGTSPPVLQRIRGWRGPAARVPGRLDVVRAYLHLLGPATPAMVAGFLDAGSKDVKERWPDDVVEVDVEGERRWILAEDAEALDGADVDPHLVRLLSPFDLFLQAKDRELLVPDAARRKELWVVLGRPGAVLSGGQIVGSWRPRAAGTKLRIRLDTWSRVAKRALSEQAERLAAHRGVAFAGFTSA